MRKTGKNFKLLTLNKIFKIFVKTLNSQKTHKILNKIIKVINKIK